ncbi:alkaline shock response membrane anchor protein AmaP [uncultured Cetobacterium sp.]|uniref:alkaline shock response membrane anchor protein AmaP n=2 Tax=uncultured Cetobacterium sp. TaxID=527638 RepID=UPI002635E21B|nr:alkaline shock response membrane anchor protein AmaP [uncultured Cetobacterium sp.]
MIKKIIFFFAWVGIFAMSIVGFAYMVMPSYFSNIDTTSLLFKIVVLNICLIYFIISLLKLFSKFSKEEDYVIKNENGTVHISTETVKSLVKELLSKDRDIRSLKIDCGKKGRKFYIIINLEILSNSSIAAKTTDIQSYIKNTLDEKLDLKVDVIEVRISKLSMKKDPVV